MGTITFVEHDGTEHSADLEAGKSLMQIALDHGIPSIDADCGGECACGTCHVILDAQWIVQVGTASASELRMLDLTPEKTPTSRLACQVHVSEDMNGMRVNLPEYQL
ncbi:2Fe-2S iron-sulfur cluster binding domain-containing protein [Acinetobacter sp. ANC 4779]|uniref:2Fe-2S iron-sulfur cluster-binding protein n=1 Tax=Acinetobacter sp. ANC 4779 TaxID=2529848 RepID=UPI00103BB234|nr:2Fe-2S iron-sulfur cluster-binding protein [Acinetobacter sp. ANC 4779]TCB49551.1 2Fe-2S iron-sulfur cluster binding domain-containing protein [Acinetobacter sp. ANC 4779]